MKRLAALLTLGAALALLPAQAAPADTLNLTAGVFPDDQLDALSASGYHFAVGGGTAGDVSTTHFAFSAHGGPNGPSGYVVLNDPVLGKAQGDVCAVSVVPPEASIWFQVKKGSGTFGTFQVLRLIVADVSGTLGADAFHVLTTTGCGGPGETEIAGTTVLQGNIVVK